MKVAGWVGGAGSGSSPDRTLVCHDAIPAYLVLGSYLAARVEVRADVCVPVLVEPAGTYEWFLAGGAIATGPVRGTRLHR